jgi:uncharacterized membrane protein YiaA
MYRVSFTVKRPTKFNTIIYKHTTFEISANHNSFNYHGICQLIKKLTVYLLHIGCQNFTRIHKENGMLQVLLLVQQKK